MTIGITGPGPTPPRRSALAGLIVAAIIGGICLFLLGRASDVLVDWLTGRITMATGEAATGEAAPGAAPAGR